ncbi:Uncharacterised protein [BD1-7 clade bacterium]|uniref:Uncharacterized protein n=1 Tax=BD1-7 clade bacterium TaxID=2029982 RepID=A0A5S9QX83_9GAMM|nr:Uncharacterised protein [BD1-7 clade bacterium]
MAHYHEYLTGSFQATIHHLSDCGQLFILMPESQEPVPAVATFQLPAKEWRPGMTVMVTVTDTNSTPVVTGRIFDCVIASTPEKLCIEATESIEIGVGENRFIINQNRVVLKAAAIISRALGLNKIRGSSVRIN